MPDFSQAKTMAKLLRQGLEKRQIDITHSDSLELVAKQFGYANWNVLAAKVEEISNNADLKTPKNWKASGVASHLYQCGVDPDRGKGIATIYNRPDKDTPGTNDFCTLMQSIAAEKFNGKKNCLTAELKTEAATGAGTIWMRIDNKNGTVLKFDNMQNRTVDGPLTGTRDWAERQILMIVPKAATSIHYGFFLRGAGQTWCRKIRLEETTSDAPETLTEPNLLQHPANMDFLEIAI